MTRRYSPEVQARAVRLVLEHEADHSSQWRRSSRLPRRSAVRRRRWVRWAERDMGQRAGPTTDQLAQLKALERENRKLRQANEILRKTSAYFAPLSANACIRLPGNGQTEDQSAVAAPVEPRLYIGQAYGGDQEACDAVQSTPQLRHPPCWRRTRTFG